MVDKKDVPVQGALVEVKGSTEQITTDFDGSFSITMPPKTKKLKATYVGLNTATKTAKDGMKIKLSKSGWWNYKPERGSWFVLAEGLKPYDGYKGLEPGLMFGYVKNFGIYAKGLYRPFKDDEDHYYGKDRYLTGETGFGGVYAGGGLIARLKGQLYLYAGAGFREQEVYWKYQDRNGHYWREMLWADGTSVDVGFMASWGHLFVNAGLMYLVDDYRCDDGVMNNYHSYWYYTDSDFNEKLQLNVGIGIKF